MCSTYLTSKKTNLEVFYDSLIIRCRCSNWSFLFYFLFFRYQNLETFIIDVNLVFDNCEKFNEDNSDIGRAGHNMRKFFEKRWTELLKQTNWGGLGPPRAVISNLQPGLKSHRSVCDTEPSGPTNPTSTPKETQDSGCLCAIPFPSRKEKSHWNFNHQSCIRRKIPFHYL